MPENCKITAISCSSDASCCIDEKQRLIGFGSNTLGELGFNLKSHNIFIPRMNDKFAKNNIKLTKLFCGSAYIRCSFLMRIILILT